MDIQCKKCGYKRTDTDDASEEVCPSCGAFYAKVEEALNRGVDLQGSKNRKSQNEAREDASFGSESAFPACISCGEKVHVMAVNCPKCGKKYPTVKATAHSIPKSLAMFAGCLVFWLGFLYFFG